jgi:hypothetical protein
MRISLLAGVIADKCTDLCQFDGPGVCTDGSWTKNGNICHKYVYRGNPKNMDYCYHTATTREQCPGNGAPVKVEDVDSLIIHKRGPGRSTTVEPELPVPTTSQVPILGTSDVEPMTPKKNSAQTTTSTPDSSASSFWDELEKKLKRPGFTFPEHEGVRTLSREIRKLGAEATWGRMKGPQLLEFVQNAPYNFDTVDTAVVWLSMIANAATDRPNVDVEAFAVQTGLRALFAFHAEQIREKIRRDMTWSIVPFLQLGQILNIVDEHTFIRNIDKLCPEVLNSVDMRAFVLSRKLFARFAPSLTRYAHFAIDREDCFNQSRLQINAAVPTGLSIGVSNIQFRGENAFGDGVRKDWFSLVAKGLMLSGIFSMSLEGKRNTYLVEGLSDIDAGLYTTAGRFLALAVIHRRPLGITLPTWFFARILGKPITLEDIKDDEPHIFAMLDLILKAETDEQLEMYPMELDGQEVQTTLANREQGVQRRIRALIPASVESQFQRIRESFLSVIPAEYFDGLLSPREIRNLIVGTLDINIEDMIANMKYAGGHVNSPQIVWLHRLLRSLTAQQSRQFVHLVTSSSHVPFEGFAGLKPLMTIDIHNDTSKLPKSSTCFNQLHLPRYSTEEELRDKLLHAIANAEVPMFYAPN